jgi:hypothetical protein
VKPAGISGSKEGISKNGIKELVINSKKKNCRDLY